MSHWTRSVLAATSLGQANRDRHDSSATQDNSDQLSSPESLHTLGAHRLGVGCGPGARELGSSRVSVQASRPNPGTQWVPDVSKRAGRYGLPRQFDAPPCKGCCPAGEEYPRRPDRHGKERVAGSRPAEGFRNRATARFLFASDLDDHFQAQRKGWPVARTRRSCSCVFTGRARRRGQSTGGRSAAPRSVRKQGSRVARHARPANTLPDTAGPAVLPPTRAA